ncbi:MAG: hypothetical protein VKL58_06350 [Cyanobacteriota bacterium]|jgi:hypothetical protein|nr:hypothetical protein [Cyanobacteriota bacterium]
MSFWTPGIDSANPLACSQPERYVLRRVGMDAYLGIDRRDQSIMDVRLIEQAHHFRTHEAAVRAASELERMGRGPVDVIKVEKA